MSPQRSRKRGPQEPAVSEENLGLAAFCQIPPTSGLALDELSAALAKMLGQGDDPYRDGAATPVDSTTQSAPDEVAIDPAGGQADDDYEVTPRSILEAMLFVGSPDNEPLTSKHVAGLMRGVRPAEIDALVRELNEAYDSRRCPYRIIADGPGYRLALRDEYSGVRDKFHGRARQARLSQAAIEVLAAVAYHAPVTVDEISRMRGVASGAVLTQLVRRQLVRLERSTGKPRRVQYSTTPRFLQLFGLESLDDLPRSQDLEQK
jgi:segregation and condensation protein B